MELIVGNHMDELLALADKAVQGMKQASAGKAPETPTETNASTFANLADLVSNLTALARRERIEKEQMAHALSRVAGLQVRSAKELLEQKNWQKLLTEIQAIAQDAIGHTGR